MRVKKRVKCSTIKIQKTKRDYSDSNSLGGIRIHPLEREMPKITPRRKAPRQDQLNEALQGELATYEKVGLFQRSLTKKTAYRYRGRASLAGQGLLPMTRRQSEIFLRTLVSDLLAECSHWGIPDHCKIEWNGQPRNMWPEADIVIDTGTRRFIIEYDEDSDPCRSLTKYWPIIHQGEGLLTIIEVWKRGSTVGRGYAELAKWMATRLREMYPTFDYKFFERIEETSRPIARAITQTIKASCRS